MNQLLTLLFAADVVNSLWLLFDPWKALAFWFDGDVPCDAASEATLPACDFLSHSLRRTSWRGVVGALALVKLCAMASSSRALRRALGSSLALAYTAVFVLSLAPPCSDAYAATCARVERLVPLVHYGTRLGVALPVSRFAGVAGCVLVLVVSLALGERRRASSSAAPRLYVAANGALTLALVVSAFVAAAMFVHVSPSLHNSPARLASLSDTFARTVVAVADDATAAADARQSARFAHVISDAMLWLAHASSAVFLALALFSRTRTTRQCAAFVVACSSAASIVGMGVNVPRFNVPELDGVLEPLRAYVAALPAFGADARLFGAMPERDERWFGSAWWLCLVVATLLLLVGEETREVVRRSSSKQLLLLSSSASSASSASSSKKKRRPLTASSASSVHQ